MDIEYAYNVVIEKNNFKKRDEQLQMAKDIESALKEGGVAFLESPTGTGKTLAYLLAVYCYCIEDLSRSVVIATPHLQLQSQMDDEFVKIKNSFPDLEANEKIKGPVVLKGRYNYLSIVRVREQVLSAEDEDRGEEFKVLMRELELKADEADGDPGRLGLTLIKALREYEVDIEDLFIKKGDKGEHLTYYKRALKNSADANIVITNHFALAWHRRIRGQNAAFSDSRLIIDEAHELPRNLELAQTEGIAFNTARWAIRNLISALKSNKRGNVKKAIKKRILKELQPVYRNINKLISDVRNEAIDNDIDIIELREPEGYSELEIAKRRCCEGVFTLHRYVNRAMDIVSPLVGNFDLSKLVDELKGVSKTLNDIVFSSRFDDEDNYVCYFIGFSPVRRYPSVHRVSPDKYPFLSKLWKGYKTIVLTSGTLSDHDKRDFKTIMNLLMMKNICHTIGISSKRFFIGFDFRDKINVFVYNEVPEYFFKDPSEFLESATEILDDIVEQAQGGVLILSPAHIEAMELAKRLKDVCSKKVLYYGPDHKEIKRKVRKEDVIKEFLEKKCVLVSASFWTGVDLKGELSDLVITRIPNPNPNAPTEKARWKFYSKMFKDNPKIAQAFLHFHRMFETLIRFKQGCGRLGRDEDDRGNIHIMDSRILNGNYRGFLEFLKNKYNFVDTSSTSIDAISSGERRQQVG